MRRVYIINRGPHNYDAAKEFGELVYCSDGSVNRDDLAQMYRLLCKALKDSEPSDLLLLTSLTSMCSVACSIFAVMHGELHLLLHRGAGEDGYLERSLYFDQQDT